MIYKFDTVTCGDPIHTTIDELHWNRFLSLERWISKGDESSLGLSINLWKLQARISAIRAVEWSLGASIHGRPWKDRDLYFDLYFGPFTLSLIFLENDPYMFETPPEREARLMEMEVPGQDSSQNSADWSHPKHAFGR